MLLSIIYILGMASCGISGSKKSYQLHGFFFCVPAVFFASHGGGLIRDLFILRVFPAAFSHECLPDILVALCSGVLYRTLALKRTSKNVIEPLINMLDALSLGSFISIGVDKALALGASQITAFLSGTFTALGGGIVSSMLCGQPILEILTRNRAYRIVVILGATLYTHLVANGTNAILAQYNLVVYTLCFASLTSNSYLSVIAKPLIDMLQPTMAIITLIPALIMTAQYLPNVPYTYILQYPYPYPAGALPKYASNTELHIWHTLNPLTLKQLCPRRFSRGR